MPAAKRKFSMSLNPFSIGVSSDISQQKLNAFAIRYGFESVSVVTKDIMKQSTTQLDLMVAKMKEAGLHWGVSGLTVEYRKDEATFRKGIAELPAIASVLNKIGAKRMMTWIMSNHEQLNYLRNFRQMAVRLSEIASILNDHNIRLGLEYVGPKSIWSANRFPFIHTMAETKELIAAIGQPNVGFHLDTAHWFTSGEGISDILSLTNGEVIGCDLNDAIAGISWEDQPGYQRELPAATGVIDIKGFLNALIKIEYDGPIQAEPFNDRLNNLDDESAIKSTAEAMKKAFALNS
ncbi:sugar phosphate isomerase/epimerase family protein [Flavitalea sp.]|nr:sugar phosphate isomerase/epimerase [Flavitalea sp.]